MMHGKTIIFLGQIHLRNYTKVLFLTQIHLYYEKKLRIYERPLDKGYLR